MLLLIVQHLGGVTSLLKGIHKNPVHRKFGFVVSNFARIVSVFGFLLVKKENIANYLGVATVVLLVISGYLTFFGKHDKVQVTKVEIGSAKPRR